MWGRKKRKAAKQLNTVLSQQTRIVGDLSFSGVLFVDGHVKGDVVSDSDGDSLVTIGINGIVEGEVRVPRVIIYGRVAGDVKASERVELRTGSKLQGNLYYQTMEMHAGAEVNGKMVSMVEPTLALGHSPEGGESGTHDEVVEKDHE